MKEVKEVKETNKVSKFQKEMIERLEPKTPEKTISIQEKDAKLAIASQIQALTMQNSNLYKDLDKAMEDLDDAIYPKEVISRDPNLLINKHVLYIDYIYPKEVISRDPNGYTNKILNATKNVNSIKNAIKVVNETIVMFENILKDKF